MTAKTTIKHERLLSTLLLLVSFLIGILLMEIGWRIYSAEFAALPVYSWHKRILFFSGKGTVFRNLGQIFTYVPNSNVYSLAVYFSDNNYVVEYDYKFHVNNYGLVQDNDIVPSKSSLLVLGDSFTEGQGAEPWFRQLRPHIENSGYQSINGGVLGTGFLQWWKLREHLSTSGIQIQKLMVIFISDDYTRTKLWNFPDYVLRCLTSLQFCNGQEGFYPVPSSEDLSAWVNRIRTVREPPNKERLKRLAPASYEVFRLVRTFLSPPPKTPINRTPMVIGEMINTYGAQNVIFLHLPMKHETQGPNADGMEVRRLITAAGGKLIDGFKKCGLTSTDYFVHDGHPNAAGYSKIAKCAARALEPLMAGAS
jgi:hypothetical protein